MNILWMNDPPKHRDPGQPGYDPNRIPSKQSNSCLWLIATITTATAVLVALIP